MPSSQTVKQEPACGLRFWRVRRTSSMTRPHAHPDVELNFLTAGGPFHYRHPEGMTAVRNHELLVFWAGLPHQLHARKGTAPGVWATIPLSLILEWDLPGEFAARLLRGEYFRSGKSLGDAERMNRWLADHESGDAARLRVLLLELQAHLHRVALNSIRCDSNECPVAPPGGGHHLAKLVNFMAANYRHALSVEQIAGAAGLHPRYAMRLFHKNFNLGIWEYLTRLRVSHARTMLALTNRKIIDVAMDCGFASPSAFYAAFRKLSAGNSPGKERRRNHPTRRASRKRIQSK